MVYGHDDIAVTNYVSALPARWREKQVTYLLVTAYDFRRDLHQAALKTLMTLARDGSRFEPVYADPVAQLYRVVGQR